jgi:hypothetical protein
MHLVPSTSNYLFGSEEPGYASLVLDRRVYAYHPGLYYRYCGQTYGTQDPEPRPHWNTIKRLDYKIFGDSDKWVGHYRKDLVSFLDNTQEFKQLHISLDDEYLELSWPLLAQHFRNLSWRGCLFLQIVNRGRHDHTIDYYTDLVSRFFRDRAIMSLEYYHQTVYGARNSTGWFVDLKISNEPVPYTYDPITEVERYYNIPQNR